MDKTDDEILATLSPAALAALNPCGEWTDEGGAELVRTGLAIPTQILFTKRGQILARKLSKESANG